MAYSSLPYKVTCLAALAAVFVGFISLWSPGQTAQWDVTGVSQVEGPVTLDQGARYHLDLVVCLPRGQTFTINARVTAVVSGLLETYNDQSFAYARAGKNGCLSMRGISYFTAAEGGPHMVSWNASANLVALRPVIVLKREWMSPATGAFLVVAGIIGIIGGLYAWVRKDSIENLPREVGLKRFGHEEHHPLPPSAAPKPGVARAVAAPASSGPPLSIEPLWTFTDMRQFARVRVSSDGAWIAAIMKPVAFGGGAHGLAFFSPAGDQGEELHGPNLAGDAALIGGPTLLERGGAREGFVLRWSTEVIAVEMRRAAAWRKKREGSKTRFTAIAGAADGHITYLAGNRLMALDKAGDELWSAPLSVFLSDLATPADGRYLAVAGFDKEVRIYDPGGRETMKLQLGVGVRRLEVARDGSRLLPLADMDALVMFNEAGERLWETVVGARTRLAAMPTEGSFVVAVTADGGVVCLGGAGNKLWRESWDDVIDIDVTPDGSLLLVARGHTLHAYRLVR